MKKHTLLSDLAVFLLIIFLFIVPPFLTTAQPSGKTLFSLWSFPWYQILLALTGSLILFFFYDKSQAARVDQTGSVTDRLWQRLIVFPLVFTFGMLFAISLFCRFLAEITGSYDAELLVTKPVNALQWLFCLLNFLCAAFYEEVLYRFYFVDQLFDLITRKKIWRGSRILCEVLGLLVFAFAHLYMGWNSVLNAALAHVVLRLCYKKSCRLWPCVAAHFIYNVISLILL
jgi:membrane protease YdiL (CAAX protease family)